MIVKIRKSQRKSETKKKIKATKARYIHKTSKVIKYKKPTLYDNYIENIIKKIY